MLDSRQQVEESGIDRLYFVGAEVAQDVVDSVEFARDVMSIFPVGRLQTLAGMERVELQRAASKLNGGAGKRDCRNYELCGRNRANAEEAPPRQVREMPGLRLCRFPHSSSPRS